MNEDQGLRHPSIVAYRPIVHIAHVSDCYAPRTGGIETQVTALVAQQRMAGDEVSVLTATPGSSNDAIRLTSRIPFDLPIHPRTYRVVTEQLRRTHPDIVHVHVGAISPFAWEAVRAAHDLGFPVVVTVHSMWGPLSQRGYALSRSFLRWDQWGVRVCAVSSVAAAAVARVIPMEIGLTPNGIDPHPWQESGEPQADAPLRLVSVLRLAPRKRVLALIRMFHQVLHVIPDARLTIVGDGPLYGVAQRRARGLPVDFTGRLSREQIVSTFSHSHVFWQPSIRESFGLAALEARCAGLPVIARTQSGAGEFITDRKNGWLVESDAMAIQRLITTDMPQWAQMRRTNREIPPPVTWQRVLPVIREQYALAQ
jgi:phosphatidylinositol alpha 1,6-mannosyltransferase